jgi:hypothetical protein
LHAERFVLDADGPQPLGNGDGELAAVQEVGRPFVVVRLGSARMVSRLSCFRASMNPWKTLSLATVPKTAVAAAGLTDDATGPRKPPKGLARLTAGVLLENGVSCPASDPT